ncbi:unnamed protein product, partial [Symbiodinium sp. CCMP2592]
NDELMMETIVSGDVPIHSTRTPMISSALQVILGNIQKPLKLAAAQSGGCSVLAKEQYFKILAKRKRVRKEPPAIIDAPPTAVMNPPEIVDNTEPKENQNPETDNLEEDQNHEQQSRGDMRKMLKDTESETYTWTAEWGDAWNSMLRTLDDGYDNPKRRRVAYRVLKALKEATAEWNRA